MATQIRVRPAAVAGLFYPDDPVALRSTVLSLLAARSRGAAGAAAWRAPKAVIAPHAGYSVSGPIAASAFAALAPGAASAAGGGSAADVRRVVLLGPSHQVPLRGLGLPGAERFATPLGMVPLDLEAAAAVERLPQVAVRP